MKRLRIVFVLPSRYDDDGYVNRYVWGVLPSNTLTCMRSLALDAIARGELGPDIAAEVEIYDDSLHAVDPAKIARRCRRNRELLIAGLVGVQSNQFPRAADLALAFRETGAAVLLGGFHVSGVYAMFDAPDYAMQEMIDAGVTLVAGETEAPGVLGAILRDAANNTLQPVYRVTGAPDITDAPVPAPDTRYLRRFIGKMGTMDTSRGCPFDCSFCTIINVQGKKMRYRSAETMLKSIEDHFDRGVINYFFTDDNFSRSPVWKDLFAGLKALRDRGRKVEFMMQVDAQAWRIPGFIEGAAAAGCFIVFIGMETLNEANLKAASKRQNKVSQYAEMVEAWHRAGVLVHAGYILGFPNDTPASIRRDLEVLKNRVKVDEASFFILTPIPGSRDHLDMVRNKIPIDADFNNYEGTHENFRHPNFAPGELRAAYFEAWDSFFSKENMANILLRTPRDRYWRTMWVLFFNRYMTLMRTHMMVGGGIRLKDRRSRRSLFPREGRIRYAWRRAKDLAREFGVWLRLFAELQEIWLLTRWKNDPAARAAAQLRDAWYAVQTDVDGMDDAEDKAAAIGLYVEEFRRKLNEIAETCAADQTRFRKEIVELRHRLDKSHEPGLERRRELIHETLTAFENLINAKVARRRRYNQWYAGGMLRLRDPRFIASLPAVAFNEIRLGIGFLYSFWQAAAHRLRTAPDA